MRRVAILTSLCMLLATPLSALAQQQWFKGNTHVHTINSDGNASPDIVARWYKEHRYHFVFITDHDLRTAVDGLNGILAAPGRFLVLPGVEVTDRFAGRPVHLNGLGVDETVLPQGGTDVTNVIDQNAEAIQRADGLPVIDHPNGLLSAALTAHEIGSVAQVWHFEVCCADYRGGSGRPSTEEIWDEILSSGRQLFGIAADDAHLFGGESKDPGSAWIMVRADELTPAAILGAIGAGDFYATTGVELLDLTVDDRGLCMEISGTEDYGFRTFFIGRGGAILKRDESASPSYRFQPADQYVRARIERSDGALAWIQPVFQHHP